MVRPLEMCNEFVPFSNLNSNYVLLCVQSIMCKLCGDIFLEKDCPFCDRHIRISISDGERSDGSFNFNLV